MVGKRIQTSAFLNLGLFSMREIFRCQELDIARRSATHPCSKIAGAQAYSFAENPPFQIPEPWRGDLSVAPLPFISSNPAIDQTDDSPWNTEPDEKITEYFNLGFGSTFPRILHPNGPEGRLRETNVKFWSNIQKCAAEKKTKETYALAETSQSPRLFTVSRHPNMEWKKTRDKCFKLHMPAILRKSAAVVVCTLGRHAEEAFRNLTVETLSGVAIVVGLGHPNARRRTAGENDLPPLAPNVAGLPPDLVTRIRERLRGKDTSRAEPPPPSGISG
jgi:hypothetical protein